MNFNEPIAKKRSLGKLRKTPKTKTEIIQHDRYTTQHHPATAILQNEGSYLTVEISPKYVNAGISTA